MKKISEKLKEKKAETLLELVISIALFGLMMVMTASMFAAANTSTMKNIKSDRALDNSISSVVSGVNPDSTDNLTVIFKRDDNKIIEEKVKRIQTGAVYKFE